MDRYAILTLLVMAIAATAVKKAIIPIYEPQPIICIDERAEEIGVQYRKEAIENIPNSGRQRTILKERKI